MASDFKILEEQIAPHHVGNRTESTAMLAWFFEHAWRLDPDEVEAALCDGGNDKGIDAITVDPDAREITIFQGKRRRSAAKTQGEADLQKFRAVATYFRGPDGIDDLLAAAPNAELKKLVRRHDLRALLDEAEPWSVSLVYVTNAKLDASAMSYLRTTRDESPPLIIWARQDIAAVARRTERPGLLAGDYTVVPCSDVLIEELDNGVSMAIALIPANELVRLPGIDDLTLFALNVRLGLGRTKINKELAKTIKDEQADHALFPAYHNGITILSKELSADQDGLHLDGITVVNGCQSLLQLWANRASLTPELSLLVKAVQLGPDVALGDVITYRSNNQNAVNLRDQRANDPIQRDLQRQVAGTYGGRLFFAVRRGEQAPAGHEVLENQDAAQLIMALWLREPWAAVRKLSLFDEEYRRIFGRAVDAHKLYLAHRINQMISDRRGDLLDSLSASFAAVRFTIAHLTAQVVRASDLGAEFFEEPGRWLPDRESEVLEKLSELMDHVVEELNNQVEVREEAADDDEQPAFDAKTAFKSQSQIRTLEKGTMSVTKVLARRVDDFLFDVKPAR
jgi:hypothetical protein